MAREALSKLTQLPEQHKALETRVSKLESQLQEQANHIGEALLPLLSPIPSLTSRGPCVYWEQGQSFGFEATVTVGEVLKTLSADEALASLICF